MVDKKEILNQIVNVLEKPFVTHGFRYVRGGRLYESYLMETQNSNII